MLFCVAQKTKLHFIMFIFTTWTFFIFQITVCLQNLNEIPIVCTFLNVTQINGTVTKIKPKSKHPTRKKVSLSRFSSLPKPSLSQNPSSRIQLCRKEQDREVSHSSTENQNWLSHKISWAALSTQLKFQELPKGPLALLQSNSLISHNFKKRELISRDL